MGITDGGNWRIRTGGEMLWVGNSRNVTGCASFLSGNWRVAFVGGGG